MAHALKVLITNVCMHGRSGTEMCVFDLACGLLRRGHTPIVYSPVQGGGGPTELARKSVPVVDRLDSIGEVPDIVHGHHTLETLSAMLFFPDTPDIFLCHDCDAWHDTAPMPPRCRNTSANTMAWRRFTGNCSTCTLR